MNRPRWVLLVYQIPREPSRHRVAVWRKLQDLGALYLQDGVAALPEDAITREQMEWLQLRVREAGGEANLWEGRPGTVAEEVELVEAFRSLREKTYRAITAGAERLRRKAEMGGCVLEQLGKLERGFRAERRRDFFRSPLRLQAADALKAAREAARVSEGSAGSLGCRGRDLMLWATRRGCHVDRTACIWLIRRFIDPEATFSFFGDPAEAPEGVELFDVVGARLSHRGEDCSFETFLKDYELEDRVLHEIAEIVHDADLMDEKYGRPESEGLDAIVRGMQLSLPDDQTLTFHTDILYEGLYAYLSREVL